jgi:hypothetical protein
MQPLFGFMEFGIWSFDVGREAKTTLLSMQFSTIKYFALAELPFLK